MSEKTKIIETMIDTQIETLVDQARKLFTETSIFEVFDLPSRQEVINTLVEFYGLIDVRKIDRYLSILGQLRDHLNSECVKFLTLKLV